MEASQPPDTAGVDVSVEPAHAWLVQAQTSSGGFRMPAQMIQKSHGVLHGGLDAYATADHKPSPSQKRWTSTVSNKHVRQTSPSSGLRCFVLILKLKPWHSLFCTGSGAEGVAFRPKSFNAASMSTSGSDSTRSFAFLSCFFFFFFCFWDFDWPRLAASVCADCLGESSSAAGSGSSS